MVGELLWLPGVAVWVVLLMAWAFSIYRKRRDGTFFTEHALVIGSLLLLSIAPCVLVVIRFAGGVPSLGHITIHLLGAVLLLVAAFVSRRRRLDPTFEGSSHTFREKSAMLIVLGQLLVFLTYFYFNWAASLETMIPAFIGAVVLLVVIMVIGHITIALFHYPVNEIDEPVDQMATQIETLSSRNGNVVILAGFWTVPFLALSPAPATLVINCWLACLVLATVVRYSSVVAYWRWGTD